MSRLGVGVMLRMLSGYGDTAEALQASIGKIISQVKLENNELIFTLVDDSKLKLWDNGQSCCEQRWMHTDDDLDYYASSTLLGVELQDGPSEGDGDWGGVKESQFLIITTSLGQFTIVNYNDHNGYYGGFSIEATLN